MFEENIKSLIMLEANNHMDIFQTTARGLYTYTPRTERFALHSAVRFQKVSSS